MPDSRAAAFARLYRAEYATVLAYCRNRVDDAELARDLAAEVFRALWSRFDEPRRSDRAWVLGVAQHLVIDEYRRRGRRGAHQALDDAAESADPRAAAGFERADVRRALDGLAEADRELLRLRYWDDLPAPDIAKLLGTSVAATWMRLSRARRAFSAAYLDRPAADRPAASEGSAR